MKRYDPLHAPDPEEWLALDESERIELAVQYHRQAGVKLPDVRAHSILHAIIEAQVAMGDELPVRGTLDKLQEEGLDRHDAVHAIASVLVKHMHDLLKKRMPPSGDPKDAYWRELEKLTAEGWLNSG